MTILTEITVAEPDENGAYKPVRGSGLKPYVIQLNELTGLGDLFRIRAAEAFNASLPEELAMLRQPVPVQSVVINVDEEAQERGFHIMQQKIMLAGYWGVDHLAEDDLDKFGKEFPEAHLSIVEASSPKPNGHLDALKNYVRRDYVRGRLASTWRAQPIQWDQFS
jgi:hypothetical protein